MTNKNDKVVARAIYGTTAAVLKMIEKGNTLEEVARSVTTIQGLVAEEALNSEQDRKALDYGLELAMQGGWKDFI